MRLPSRLWLCTAVTDMRKSYDGLAALVRGQFGENPTCGDGFVFINRRRTHMKCLYFDAGGYCIFGKRLERGLFAQSDSSEPRVQLSQTEFNALMEGLDIAIMRRRKRYKINV